MDFDSLVQKKKINLSGQSLGDGDLDVLVQVLQKSKVLVDLNLMLNQITLADAKFTDALAENRTLKTLSLYNNQIGKKGAKLLADALAANSTLEQLFLEGNQVGDEGAKSLAQAVMTNTGLEVLILRGNGIGDAGASDLATSFLFNKSLRVVLLGENEIGNAGATSLADALEYNHMIDQIMVDSNPMSNVLELKIRNVLTKPSRKNPSSQPCLPKKVVEHLMAQKDKELAEKNSALKALLSDLVGKDEIISAQSDEGDIIKTLETVIAKKDEDLAKKDEELAIKDRKIERRDIAITSKATEIARRDRILAKKDEQIASLKKTLNSPLELLVMFIERKDNEILSLKAALEKSHAEDVESDDSDDSDDSEECEDSDDSSDEDYEDDDVDQENIAPVQILKNNMAVLSMQNKNVEAATNNDITKEMMVPEIDHDREENLNEREMLA